ncbi:MAG TPA: sulfite exporter TauE/SafE family protein [Bacteroidales bacterium]|nr:sulfite exporter TauE/SafE family protein [Bacteroidales bacterium]
MDAGLPYLLLTAAFVGFFHTLTGPDHYLPFVMIARARNWSPMKTFWIALSCGIGHVGSSILLGIIGVFAGIGVEKLNVVEASRGEIASWIIIIFGLGYMIWGLIHARKHKHGHSHHHGLTEGSSDSKKANVTPWILFLIFVFGPCEPLIPLFIYPAAQQSMTGVVWVSIVFTIATLITMLTIIMLSLRGLSSVRLGFAERYTHAIAGATICLCGLAIVFLGL